ncbi:TetR family transcriptional regulator [Murinocardiopsis flavida]|uniref:TetR family transcriptional regulator n=1 Tax=Murinocardiopsis flavida TaxID=645275 RepID=A0A2P8CLY8_9ACTN|nr:TetR family transcriptional regulator [Murinocardiopsis flavida]PSK85986.1 TetR family transcriptional regulator [Murinocardiopsis flavida]
MTGTLTAAFGPEAPPPGEGGGAMPQRPQDDPDSLRERKKHRTRESLIDAAFDLFEDKGFEHTTVEEIAAAAEVSPRTFSRYFGLKEDVVLWFLRRQHDRFLAELVARPAGEPPVAAMRAAALRSFPPGHDPASRAEYRWLRRAQRLVGASPALFARNAERRVRVEREMVDEVARRMGVDPAADFRPRIAVGVQMAVYAAALEKLEAAARAPRTGAAGPVADTPEALRRLFDEAHSTLADVVR